MGCRPWGGVYKQRLARPGEGQSGGYRVILFFRSEYRTFFVGGFPKSRQANIGRKALAQAKQQAKTLFAMTEAQITAALAAGIFEEINNLALKSGQRPGDVCCFGKVYVSGSIPFITS